MDARRLAAALQASWHAAEGWVGGDLRHLRRGAARAGLQQSAGIDGRAHARTPRRRHPAPLPHILACFAALVWPVPFGLLLSLAANDFVLPGIGTYVPEPPQPAAAAQQGGAAGLQQGVWPAGAPQQQQALGRRRRQQQHHGALRQFG